MTMPCDHRLNFSYLCLLVFSFNEIMKNFGKSAERFKDMNNKETIAKAQLVLSITENGNNYN